MQPLVRALVVLGASAFASVAIANGPELPGSAADVPSASPQAQESKAAPAKDDAFDQSDLAKRVSCDAANCNAADCDALTPLTPGLKAICSGPNVASLNWIPSSGPSADTSAVRLPDGSATEPGSIQQIGSEQVPPNPDGLESFDPRSGQESTGQNITSPGVGPSWVPSVGCDPDGGLTFRWTPDRWCNIDPQLRTSFNSVGPEGVPKGGNYFAIDNLRVYFTGYVTRVIGYEVSTDITGAGNVGFTDSTGANIGLPDTIHLLDADARFEFNEYVNFWVGRFRAPADRSSLSGPFFINGWDYPFVSKYPNVFLLRDDGAAYWGEWEPAFGGQLKWQFGIFNGQGRESAGNDWPLGPANAPNTNGDPAFAMRVAVNFLDPEPGYYNFSTYYGTKDICAIGFALQTQADAVADAEHHVGSFTGWNVDFLLENKMTSWGSGTFEAAYYDYAVGGDVASPIAGLAGFVFAGWLLPQEIGCCGVYGHFRPFVRYQKYDYDSPAAAASAKEFSEGVDVGVEYVIKGHNARFTNFFGTRDLVGGPREDIYRCGLQLVF